MRKVLGVIGVWLALAVIFGAASGKGTAVIESLSMNEKITICHAAGLAGTTHFVELTISPNAVFGPGGHFNENGTTQAGHEQDYMGPCEEDETTTTETTTTTSTTTTQTTETTTTTQPPGERCPPGMSPVGGKDGDEFEPFHNQECCPDANNDQKCDVTTPPPVTGSTPPVTTTPAPNPPVTTTSPEPGETTEPAPSTPPVKQQSPPKKTSKPRPEKPKGTPKKAPPVCVPGAIETEQCGVQGSG